MTCCLTAPSHYQNQCWLAISKTLWHSFQGNVYLNTQAIKSPTDLGSKFTHWKFTLSKSLLHLTENNELNLRMPIDQASPECSASWELFILFIFFVEDQYWFDFTHMLHWYWGNHVIAPVPVKQPWRIWVNWSLESAPLSKKCWYNLHINSLRLSDAYVHQWTTQSLGQIIDWCQAIIWTNSAYYLNHIH